MKAPEKVYIDDFGSGFSHGWHTEHSYENDIEYVRTDAFIEKACEWLRENKNRYVYNKGGHGEYIPTCSNQIIEDFKKYMKGE